MRLDPQTVAKIKACRGVYPLTDTARQFSVAKSTVSDIWYGRTHAAVSPTETPNVQVSRLGPEVIREEVAVLRGRGYNMREIAEQLNTPLSTLYRKAGAVEKSGGTPCLLWF